MDRGSYRARVQGVTKSWTRLSDSHTHTHTHTPAQGWSRKSLAEPEQCLQLRQMIQVTWDETPGMTSPPVGQCLTVPRVLTHLILIKIPWGMQGSSYYWLWPREVGTEVHRDHVTGLKPQSKKLNTGNYISRFPVPNSFLCGLQFKPGVWWCGGWSLSPWMHIWITWWDL